MPRYIDADALKELIDGGFDIDFDEVPETKAALLHMIDCQETADVVERKVGNMTNADRIRSMTDEELAVWIVHKTEGNGFDGYEESVKAWLDWLKQGVTMARYIDADALIKEHIEKEKGRYGSCLVVGDNRFLQRFLNAPTADVVERKKGKWLPYEFGNGRWHKCSECGKADEYINERGLESVRKFCPNCGAEMERRE